MRENIALDRELPEREQAVVEFLLRAAFGLIPADGVSVMLLDAAGSTLAIRGVAGRGAEISSKLGIAIGIGERVAGRVALSGEPAIIVGDVSRYERFRGVQKYEEIRSGVCVPLKAGERVFGVVNLKRTRIPEPVGRPEAATLGVLARGAAEMLEAARGAGGAA